MTSLAGMLSFFRLCVSDIFRSVLAFIILAIRPNSSNQLSHLVIENSVLAEPRVDCGVESISVWIRTEKPFRGRIYVDEESEHPECIRNYAEEPNDSRGAEFFIRHLDSVNATCDGRECYSFTLVVSFHPVFLTGIDRAFNVKCFFLEAVKAVDASLDVSPLKTFSVQNEFSLPQCTYLLKQGIEGPFLKYANIGEPITHVWQCDPTTGWIYGVLIHSCFVDDGHGNRFELVDDRGCVLDHYLLSDIIYDEKAFSAFANTHVFRYADHIQLCFKEDGGCEGVTPPRCGDSKVPIPLAVSSSKSFVPDPPFKRQPADKLNPILQKSGVPTNPIRTFIPSESTRSFLQKFTDPPTNRGGPPIKPPPPNRHNLLPAGFGNAFKDSPITNETENGIIHIDNSQNRSRRTLEMGTKMETDLTTELTVLPINGNNVSYAKMSLNNEGNEFTLNKEKTKEIGIIAAVFIICLTVITMLFVIILGICILIRKKSRERPIKTFN